MNTLSAENALDLIEMNCIDPLIIIRSSGGKPEVISGFFHSSSYSLLKKLEIIRELEAARKRLVYKAVFVSLHDAESLADQIDWSNLRRAEIFRYLETVGYHRSFVARAVKNKRIRLSDLIGLYLFIDANDDFNVRSAIRQTVSRRRSSIEDTLIPLLLQSKGKVYQQEIGDGMIQRIKRCAQASKIAILTTLISDQDARKYDVTYALISSIDWSKIPEEAFLSLFELSAYDERIALAGIRKVRLSTDAVEFILRNCLSNAVANEAIPYLKVA